jgi:GPH family glycoside/pentoside/hexuronide:cation symporter
MTHRNLTSTRKLSIGQKLAYGSGSLTNNLLPAALGVFMFFLVTGYGMDPFLAGLLGGIPRFFDALTDPIMGYISDNSRTGWGRRRPYIFVGAVVTGILFILLWQMSPADGQTYNFWYFLVMSLLYITGNTIFSTPFIGLGYEMTDDYNERTKVMGIANIIGQTAWMIVPWFWALISNPDYIFATQVEGVRKLSIAVGALCIFTGVIPAIFCKEPPLPEEDSERPGVTLSGIWNVVKDVFKNLGEVFANKPFLRLCVATFLVYNGFQIVAAFANYIIVYYMFDGDYSLANNWLTWDWVPTLFRSASAWFATIQALITAFLVIPVVTWMAGKWGKKQAFVISTVISIVGYIMKWWGFSPENPWLMFLPLPLMSFGMGGLFTLMMSMTADVCDLDELKNGLPRKESQFGAIYWWMVKMGQSLALVLSGAVLKWVAFDQNIAIQAPETLTQLRLADIIIPAGSAFVAIFVMLGYNLTETKMKEIKAQLKKRYEKE